VLALDSQPSVGHEPGAFGVAPERSIERVSDTYPSPEDSACSRSDAWIPSEHPLSVMST
jgi:hypothetical protein